MNALMICGICVISVGMEGKAGIYFYADLEDLADFLKFLAVCRYGLEGMTGEQIGLGQL